MYIRKVSLEQRPIFLMVLGSIPCKWMVITPPALKLWLPNKPWCRPFLTKPNCITADFIALLLPFAKMTRPLQQGVWKYVLIIDFEFDVLARIWRRWRIRARMVKNHYDGLLLDEWLKIVTCFSDWKLTLLQLYKVHLIYWLVGIGLTW